MVLATLVAALAVSVTVHVLGLALAGRLAGAGLAEVALFMGPAALRWERGGTIYRINWLPVGGWVRFAPGHEHLGVLRRLLALAGGSAGLLLLAALALGPGRALHELLSGFPQLVMGALQPRTTGAGLLHALHAHLGAQGLLASLGLVAAKVAAANLLPLPSLNGGQMLGILIRRALPASERLGGAAQVLGVLLALGLAAGWGAALVAAR